MERLRGFEGSLGLSVREVCVCVHVCVRISTEKTSWTKLSRRTKSMLITSSPLKPK